MTRHDPNRGIADETFWDSFVDEVEAEMQRLQDAQEAIAEVRDNLRLLVLKADQHVGRAPHACSCGAPTDMGCPVCAGILAGGPHDGSAA